MALVLFASYPLVCGLVLTIVLKLGPDPKIGTGLQIEKNKVCRDGGKLEIKQFNVKVKENNEKLVSFSGSSHFNLFFFNHHCYGYVLSIKPS